MTGEAPESKVVSTDTDNEEPSLEPNDSIKEVPVATGKEDTEEKAIENSGIDNDSNHTDGSDNVADKTFPSRFPLWYALTIFSAVSLISLCTETNPKEWYAEENFLLFVTVFSLVMSSVACMGNIVKRENFVGQPLEGLWVRMQNMIIIIRPDLNTLFAYGNCYDDCVPHRPLPFPNYYHLYAALYRTRSMGGWLDCDDGHGKHVGCGCGG